MKKLMLACVISVVSVGSFAHAPFVAPSSYLVQGGHTAILAGFAEHAFDTEVAIRGFELNVVPPNGERKNLTLMNNKVISTADIETSQSGTYQVYGERSGNIKYAKVNQRWLRILDGKAESLPPLAQRNYVIPSEINAKTEQLTVNRDDQILTYFSKDKTTVLPVSQLAGLQLSYSHHPNQISLQQPFRLQLTLDRQPAVGYLVVLEKQRMNADEKEQKIKLKTDVKGEVVLPFSNVGQYLVSITSPEEAETVKPKTQTYRTIVSLWVNP